MSVRGRKAERILGVQKQLHRVEAWKLAELQRRLAELEASKIDLIGALNEDEALHGLFIDNMANRLRSLSEEAGRVVGERDLQSRKVVEQSGQVRLAERLRASIGVQDQRAAMEEELLETIEHFLRRASARLP
jgi:hypothetical protein